MSFLSISFFSVVLRSLIAFYFRLFKRSLTGGNETPPSFELDAPESVLNAAPAFALVRNSKHKCYILLKNI